MSGLQISNKRKLRCLQREMRLRFRVYAKDVANHRMTKAQMDEEIETLASIMDDYIDRIEAEERNAAA